MQSCAICAGIRILQQDPWEQDSVVLLFHKITISLVLKELCHAYVNILEKRYREAFAFPTPEVLANCTVEDLAPLRSGFRA